MLTFFIFSIGSTPSNDHMQDDAAHRNAAMSLLLPSKTIHLNAQLHMRKFRDRGNKAGAVRGLQELEKSDLGTLTSMRPQRGTTL